MNEVYFPGRIFYYRKETIFELLKEFNCVVPAQDCVYEWFVVFDFEAILRAEENSPLDRKFSGKLEHFTEPMCFVDEDPDQLIWLPI